MNVAPLLITVMHPFQLAPILSAHLIVIASQDSQIMLELVKVQLAVGLLQYVSIEAEKLVPFMVIFFPPLRAHDYNYSKYSYFTCCLVIVQKTMVV